MKITKKLTYLLLVFALVLSLAACGQEAKEDDAKTPTTEEGKEENSEEKVEEKPEEESQEAKIAKIGLGSVTSLAKSKELKDGKGAAQADTTVVAVALDAEDKIVDVKIDVAQNKAPMNDDGSLAFETSETLRTKRELGDEYGMRKASGIEKEWFEQADALEEAWIGMTIEEALNMKKDAEKDTLTDLATSVTVKVSGYQDALKKASENLVEAKDAEKLGLGIYSVFGHGTSPAKDEKGAKVQFETNMVALASDKDGKIVASIIDTAQNSVAYELDGSLSEKFNPQGTTKKELGDGYGMKKNSGIGKEWFEQIAGLEQYLVGKTLDDVKAMKLEEGKATDADLLSSVTIAIDEYQKVVTKAIEDIK
ncbi:MAG: hypothetical protein Q4E50_02830 [Tissierellia bacterium]|nr:hypothetical protein [Tissierellia bacterium]